MSLDNEAVRLAYLGKAQNRSMNEALNMPLSHKLQQRTNYVRGGAKKMTKKEKQAMGKLHSSMGKMSKKEEKAMGELHEAMGSGMSGGMSMTIEDIEGSGTKKGQTRKTARKAYEPKKGTKKGAKKGKGMTGGMKHGGQMSQKKMAEMLGEEYGKQIAMQDDQAAMVGGANAADFNRGFKRGFSMVAKDRKVGGGILGDIGDVAGFVPLPGAGVVSAGLKIADKLSGGGQERGRQDKRRMGVDAQGMEMGGAYGGAMKRKVGGAMTGGRKQRKKAGANDKRKQRGQLISKLMKEHGMTLGQASKAIKEQGLM